jgi:hypothetical protein
MELALRLFLTCRAAVSARLKPKYAVCQDARIYTRSVQLRPLPSSLTRGVQEEVGALLVRGAVKSVLPVLNADPQRREKSVELSRRTESTVFLEGFGRK